MKRKNNLVLILIFILLHLIHFIPLIHAETVYIDPSDNIQEIIDSVPSYSTIFLNEGEYNQIFEVSKPLHLIGINPETTFINTTTKMNKPAIIISSSYVTITNLTIQNNGPGLYTSGVRILNEDISINGCIFTNTPIGISIWSNNNTITECIFKNCSDEGIVLLSTIISPANNNRILECTFIDNCDGIEMQQSSNNSIISCIFTNNYHSGIDGIDCENNNNLIQDCSITNNSVHGIYFTNSQNNIIKNCFFYNNTDGHIVTPQSKRTLLENNIFKESKITTEKIYEFSTSSIDSSDKSISFNSILENIISFITGLLSPNS